jgi:predicted AlkP superfamily phosphohydrolase/phosphomutase
VILVALDGASFAEVRRLTDAGALPTFRRLLAEGASGPLASLYRELPFSPERGGGYWSPVVWNTIATGKLPEVHGVIDFLLPDPARVRVCTEAGVTEAELALAPPEGAEVLRVRVAPDSPADGWQAAVAGGAPVALAAAESALRLPAGSAATTVELRFAATTSPTPPLCLNALHYLDRAGLLAGELHFRRDRASFRRGFGEPDFGPLHGATTRHRRVKALWTIAGERGRKVAIVSWRDSWPAEPVNGYFVSDRIGRRFASRPEPMPLDASQYHPPEIRPLVVPLLQRFREVDALAEGGVLAGPCEIPDARVARVQHWSDWLAHTLATRLWDQDPAIDLLAVYYSGIDAFGHMYFSRAQASAPCRSEPPLLDRYYAQVDRYLEDWLERLDGRTSLVVVTDHGMAEGESKGEHADDGFALLDGPRFQPGAALRDADVLDVAPLVLHLLDLPLAADMPGEPPWGALERRGLAHRAPARVATYEDGVAERAFVAPSPELEAELRERLRALGYLD